MTETFFKIFGTQFLKTLDDFSLFLLVGFLLAGFIRVFIYPERIQKWIGKRNFMSVLVASCIGVPMPLCSCSVIPVGVSLRKSGASDGATISFLTSTPVTGIDSLAISFAMLPPQLALARPIVALLIGLLAGMVKILFSRDDDQPKTHSSDSNSISIKDGLNYVIYDLFPALANSLFVGVILAALMLTAIEMKWMIDLQAATTGNKFFDIALVLVAGIPIYVCATGSTPIAAALLASGMSPGLVLAFLIGGPATNITTMLAVKSMFRIKGVVLYLVVIFLGAVASAYFVDVMWPQMDLGPAAVDAHHHHNHEEAQFFWFYRVSSIVLLIGFVNYYYQNYVSQLFKKKTVVQVKGGKDISLKIESMVCMNCVKKIKKTLSDNDSVQILEVDPKQHLLKLSLKDAKDEASIRLTLKNAGFPSEDFS